MGILMENKNKINRPIVIAGIVIVLLLILIAQIRALNIKIEDIEANANNARWSIEKIKNDISSIQMDIKSIQQGQKS